MRSINEVLGTDSQLSSVRRSVAKMIKTVLLFAEHFSLHVWPEFSEGVAGDVSYHAPHTAHQGITGSTRAGHPPGIRKKVVADVANIARIGEMPASVAMRRQKTR